MLDWKTLSIRERIIGSFFSVFALVVTLAPLLVKGADFQAVLGALFVGCVVSSFVLNPASFKRPRALLVWEPMPRLCKLLAYGAGLALALRGVMVLLA